VKLIADTNVWYDIGNGSIDPTQFDDEDQLLMATPTSLLEIASGIDDKSFEERRRAAQAVLDHASEIADDTETHLARLWNVPLTMPAVNWLDGFKAIAQARHAKELETGVSDYEARVVRRIGVDLISRWREIHWKGFASEVVHILDEWIPEYESARQKGKREKLAKDNREPFKDAMRSDEIRIPLLFATFERTKLKVESVILPTPEATELAKMALKPYLDAYAEYIIRCAIEMAPQTNDFGDCESFIYLQADSALVTSDDRWVKIAQHVCPGQIIVPERL
jgi:hypothetical protein